MSQPQPPDTYHIGRAGHAEHVVRYYTGRAELSHPVPGKPGWQSTATVECDHIHLGWQEAAKCGAKLAAAETSRRNRQAKAEKISRPCEYQIAEQADAGSLAEPYTGYLNWCAAHDTHGGVIHRDREAASAQGWTCPWAGPVAAHTRAVVKKATQP